MHVWEWESYSNGNACSMGLYKNKKTAIKEIEEYRSFMQRETVYDKEAGYYHDPRYQDGECDKIVKREINIE